VAGALGASACSLRSAPTSDLWKSAPSPSIDTSGQGGGDLAVPGQGLKPACQVDPNSVPPSNTVDVPGGEFTMGCDPSADPQCATDEQPQRGVTLGDFAIDATEVTQAQYAVCVQAGKCELPYCAWDPCKDPNKPIACVYRQEAIEYCSFVGEHLPTEAQWEKAARGTDGREYPWGNDAPTCDLANFAGCGHGTVDVGTLTKGASPFGVFDMAGNVGEWTQDAYDAAAYTNQPTTDPTGPVPNADSTYSGRGGGWHSDTFWIRADTRDWYERLYVRDSMGIRCAK
jgi:formylglycine-generating enzyme required for sulfatase activity